jgi:hypothetical protein
MTDLLDELAQRWAQLFVRRCLAFLPRDDAAEVVARIVADDFVIRFVRSGEMVELELDGIRFPLGTTAELMAEDVPQNPPGAIRSAQMESGTLSGSPNDRTLHSAQVLERD